MTENKTDCKAGTNNSSISDFPNFGTELNEYISHIESLNESMPLMMSIIFSQTTKVIEEFNVFIDQHKVEGEDEKRNLRLPSFLEYQKFMEIKNDITKKTIAVDIIPKIFLVGLVSQYDAFLSRLIRILFYAKPDILNASKKTLTFEKILEMDSMDVAKEYIIEKEIESVMRENHDEQFNWLENTFKIKLREDLLSYPKFIEITERRNLLVHCNGIVSSQYVHICKKHNALDGKITVGEKLKVDPEYYSESFNCLYEFGVKLTQVFWRKFIPGQIAMADQNLVEITYNLLKEESYILLKELLRFALDVLPKYSGEEMRRIFVVNNALAHKYSGDNESAMKILDAEDWSATSIKFKFAYNVIKENYEEAINNMATIGSDGEVARDVYKEWPLFRDFIKEESFKKAYSKIFKEEFEDITETIEEIPKEDDGDGGSFR